HGLEFRTQGGTELLFLATETETILWDLENSVPSQRIRRNDGRAFHFSFDEQGKYMAAGFHDGTIRVWDVKANQLVFSARRGPRDVLPYICLDPKGKRVVYSKGTAAVVEDWEVRGGIGPVSAEGNRVAFSSDNQFLAVASHSGMVTVMDR